MAQSLLDAAHARQVAFKDGSAEREAAIERTREAFVEEIRKNSVYRQTMEVMNDPLLDQLFPLFWRHWNPIELVSRSVTKETPVEIIGRVLFSVRTIETEGEERPVPYRDPRRILPLDPVRFIGKFPVEGADFDGRGLDPVTAYLQSIGLTTMEKRIEQRFPPVRHHTYERDMSRIRKVCSSYGSGNCGVITLKSPPALGRMGDQGNLRIEAGYDLQSEDFLIKLYVGYPFDVVETFKTLEELQRKLAEILVEKGVVAVE